MNWTVVVSFLAVLATLTAAYFAWLSNQRAADLAEVEQLDARFNEIIHNLGDRDSEEVRQGAIYQMDGVWQGSPRHRPMLLKELSSFVRRSSPLEDCQKRPRRVADDIREALHFIGSHLIVPDKGADTYSVDLSFSCLHGVDLSHLNFSRADFAGTNLVQANLSGAVFPGAYFLSARLDEAQLIGTDLTCTTLANTNLSKSMIVSSKLIGADLKVANFGGAAVVGDDFTNAVFDGTNIAKDQLADSFGLDKEPEPFCFPPGQFGPIFG